MILPGQDHGFSPGRLTGKVEKDFCKSIAKIIKSTIFRLYIIKKEVITGKKLIKLLFTLVKRNSPTK